MLVRQAKDAARQWVVEEAGRIPRFYGAYFVGSINRLPEDAPFPDTSDVDVQIVLEGHEAPDDNQLFLYRDVVLEVSYAPSDHLQSPEQVLGNYPVAIHFTAPSIILDPSGRLEHLRAAVSREYAKPEWVRKRCEHARDWLLASMEWLQGTDPIHDQVFSWTFPATALAHILLVADLQNPTERKCLVASKEVLARYDHLSLHHAMLGIWGSAGLSRERVQSLLTACAEAFDAASTIVRTPFFGASTISEHARPIAIDGSRELIDRGYHREAVMWIVVTHSWCQKALHNDAPPEVRKAFTPSYRRLLDELGIASTADVQKRADEIRRLLPAVWEVSEEIIATSPAISA